MQPASEYLLPGCHVLGREHHKTANNALNARAIKYFRGKVRATPGNNLLDRAG